MGIKLKILAANFTCLYSDLHGSLRTVSGGGLEPVPPRGATNQHFRSQSTLKTTTDDIHQTLALNQLKLLLANGNGIPSDRDVEGLF